MITRKTDYAIRCILYLAEADKEFVMVSEIAEKKAISKSFVAKILQKLTKAGIVESQRGVKGGFSLARRPKDISMLDVLEAMEDPVAMNICAADTKMCGLSGTCPAHPVWVDIRKDVENSLRRWNFGKIVSSTKYKKKDS